MSEHCPHAPLGWQTAVDPPHWASLVHLPQVPAAVSQTGVAPEQLAAVRHSTQRAPAVSHWVRGAVQAAVLPAAHSPHAPLGRQTAVAPEQSAEAVQGRQVRVVPSQVGARPSQSADDTQPTQTPAATSHRDIEPPQAVRLLAEHSPQTPVDIQAGVAPPQSPSPLQARQMRVPLSQIGVPPPQSAADRQPTQTLAMPSQSGRTPLQAAVFPAVHCTQAPLG